LVYAAVEVLCMAPAHRASLIRCTCALLWLLSLTGCERSSEPARHATNPPAAVVNLEWTKFVEEFIEDYLVANPDFAVSAGRHEFDGRLRDLSADGVQNEIARLEAMRERAGAFANDDLSPEERFQREYLLSVVDGDLFWLRDARFPFTNPAWYFGAGIDPNTYVNVPYAPVQERVRAFIRYAEQIPAAAQHVRSNLETPLPRTHVDFAISGFGGLARFYRNDVPQAFAEASDEQLQSELRAAIEPAAKALDELTAWFESQRANATDDYALGPERCAAMRRMTERVTTPLERIEEIGRADLERNLKALTEACGRYAPNAAIEDCITRTQADKPEGGPVEGARQQLQELRKFVLDKALVSIPGTEEALVAEAPAYRRQNF